MTKKNVPYNFLTSQTSAINVEFTILNIEPGIKAQSSPFWIAIGQLTYLNLLKKPEDLTLLFNFEISRYKPHLAHASTMLSNLNSTQLPSTITFTRKTVEIRNSSSQFFVNKEIQSIVRKQTRKKCFRINNIEIKNLMQYLYQNYYISEI